MRYPIAIITLLGMLAGCSDSDAPAPDPSASSPAKTTQAPAAAQPAQPDEPQTQPQQPANVVRYECNDGTSFEAEMVDQGVLMVINDISYDLRQQAAESGTLYSDGTTSFLVKEGTALLTNAQGTLECKKVAPPRVGRSISDVPEPLLLEADSGSQARQGD